MSPLVSLSLSFSKPAFLLFSKKIKKPVFLSLYLLLHCSSTSTSTGCWQKKKKENKKNQAEHWWEKIHNCLRWVVGHFPPMPNKMFSCQSWVIISDFPLGNNGDLGTTYSSQHEVSPISLSFWPDEILGFSCPIK